MDTSKEYVTMCEKAVELRDEVKIDFNYYNFILQREYKSRCNSCGSYVSGAYCSDCGCETIKVLSDGYLTCEDEVPVDFPSVWLPRQDQLQEMVFDEEDHSEVYYLGIFNRWVKGLLMQKSKF